MPDFRMQQNFPIATVVDAAGRNAQLQQQSREAGNKALLEGLQSIGQVGQSLYDTKKRVAQSLALGRQFDIPDDVAKTMDPAEILQVGAIKKGQVDMNMLLNLLHPGAHGTTADPATPASAETPATPAAKPVLASNVTTTPVPEAPPMPNPAPLMPPTTGQAAAPSMPVPIPAPPPGIPQHVNKATADMALKIYEKSRPENVYTDTADGLKLTGQVPKGSVIRNPPKGPQDILDPTYQHKLEKVYIGLKAKALSNRSGGLGLEDTKVDQAIHLRKAINQYYDPKTQQYNIPPALHSEFVLGLARLMSPGGQVAQQTLDDLRQSTLREGAANTLIKMGFDPKQVGGTTQSVARFFVEQIDRQGETSEENRDGYMNYIHAQAPVDLDPNIVAKHDRVGLNSFRDILSKAPDKVNATGGLSLTGEKAQRLLQLREKKKNGSIGI